MSTIRKKELGEFIRVCDENLINKIEVKLQKQFLKPININNFVKAFSDKYSLNDKLVNKMKYTFKYALKE
jgi:hypothetical protein